MHQAAALPMLRVPDTNLAQSRHDLSQVQGPADDMIKGAITGTCRAIWRRHAGRYLAAYEYRFNRRFDLLKMVPALAKAAAATAPKPYTTLRIAETFG
jgi:hypothetical protein